MLNHFLWVLLCYLGWHLKPNTIVTYIVFLTKLAQSTSLLSLPKFRWDSFVDTWQKPTASFPMSLQRQLLHGQLYSRLAMGHITYWFHHIQWELRIASILPLHCVMWQPGNACQINYTVVEVYSCTTKLLCMLKIICSRPVFLNL